MLYNSFVDCINKISILNKSEYSNLYSIFKDKTNAYFDKYINSLSENDYFKNISKFEYYLNLENSTEKKYFNPNITAYMRDVSRFPVLDNEEEKNILKEITRLKSIIKENDISDNTLNNILVKNGYNKSIDVNLDSRKMQLKYLEKNCNNQCDINIFKTYFNYKQLKEYFFNCNLRLVLSIVQKMKIKNSDFLDDIEWGNVGLLKAIDMYNPRFNTKFSTYAYYWIKSMINRYYLKERTFVKSPAGLKQLSRQIKTYINDCYSKYGYYPNTDEMIDFIYKKEYLKRGYKRSDVYDKCVEKLNIIHMMINYDTAISLDEPIFSSDEAFIKDVICDMQVDVEKDATVFELKEEIKTAFNSISKKWAFVLLLRNGIGIYNYFSFDDFKEVVPNLDLQEQYDVWRNNGYCFTFSEIGNMFGVSKQMINQYEKSAKKALVLNKSKFMPFFD